MSIPIHTKLSQSYKFSLSLKKEVVLLNGKGNQSFIPDFVISLLKYGFRTLLPLSMATHKRGIQIMRINKIRSISLPDLMRASSFAIRGYIKTSMSNEHFSYLTYITYFNTAYMVSNIFYEKDFILMPLKL